MKVISHRGLNRVAPQNTIPAFKKAVEIGADGLENDVHLTKDGFVVVCHNYEIDETSNGSGVIEEMTLEELYEYDFGSYFSPDFAGTRIPLLEEFLELCGDLSIIDIEIKKPPEKNYEIVEKTIAMVKSRGLFDKLIISCFDAPTLAECKRVDKDVKVGMLYSPQSEFCEEIVDDMFGFAKKYSLDAYHPWVGFVNEDYIKECHENGLMVNPWTVNLESAMQKLLEWNCDSVITDLADTALKIAGKK